MKVKITKIACVDAWYGSSEALIGITGELRELGMTIIPNHISATIVPDDKEIRKKFGYFVEFYAIQVEAI